MRRLLRAVAAAVRAEYELLVDAVQEARRLRGVAQELRSWGDL